MVLVCFILYQNPEYAALYLRPLSQQMSGYKVTLLYAFGTLTLPTNVPAGACGQVYLQALDLTSCGYSDVVLLQ